VDHHDLTGYYTYRSVLNEPDPTDDFNAIRFGQGELFLWVGPDGAIRGTLAFPADPLAPEKDFMDVTGRVTSWSPVTVEFDGVGRPGTGTADFDYRYQAALAPTFSEAVAQRPTFVGTVVRAKPHGSAPAGVTASLVAVRRDFLPPKRIPGVALIPEARCLPRVVTVCSTRSGTPSAASGTPSTLSPTWRSRSTSARGGRLARPSAQTAPWSWRTAPARISCSCTER
jgi:hypothetical protein